jgi:hypothetical protein
MALIAVVVTMKQRQGERRRIRRLCGIHGGTDFLAVCSAQAWTRTE